MCNIIIRYNTYNHGHVFKYIYQVMEKVHKQCPCLHNYFYKSLNYTLWNQTHIDVWSFIQYHENKFKKKQPNDCIEQTVVHNHCDLIFFLIVFQCLPLYFKFCMCLFISKIHNSQILDIVCINICLRLQKPTFDNITNVSI